MIPMTQSAQTNRTGFIGLGNIGKPMAMQLATQRIPMQWCTTSIPKPVKSWLQQGAASIAQQPCTKLAMAAAIISGSVCATTPTPLPSWTGESGILATATALAPSVAIHSTVKLDTISKLAAIAADNKA
jgi:3-hydroxyisobutyrate dehydrogenase-like beta-hydroxyacid dehydrogenase